MDLATVVEDNGSVAQTHSDGVLVGDEFYAQDHPRTRDIQFIFHGLGVIDTHRPHVLFVQNYFVYLLIIVNLLNIVVMCCCIGNVSILEHHLDTARRLV